MLMGLALDGAGVGPRGLSGAGDLCTDQPVGSGLDWKLPLAFSAGLLPTLTVSSRCVCTYGFYLLLRLFQGSSDLTKIHALSKTWVVSGLNTKR